MRIFFALVVLGLSINGFSQSDAEWKELKGGVKYKWLSKKMIKGTDYAMAKIKFNNTTNEALSLKFQILEYQNGMQVSNSNVEEYCLTPLFNGVFKVQLLNSSKSEAENEEIILTREFSDVEVTPVPSCKSK